MIRRRFYLDELGDFEGWDTGIRDADGFAAPMFDRHQADCVMAAVSEEEDVTASWLTPAGLPQHHPVFSITLEFTDPPQVHGFQPIDTPFGTLWSIGAGVFDWVAR